MPPCSSKVADIKSILTLNRRSTTHQASKRTIIPLVEYENTSSDESNIQLANATTTVFNNDANRKPYSSVNNFESIIRYFRNRAENN